MTPRIGIIGLGNFGKFWAEWLEKGFPVETLSRHGDGSCASMAELCEKTDLIFFCVPIRKTEATLREAAPHLTARHIVADTCSVKTLPKKWLLENIPEWSCLVATHPMFGPVSGSQSLRGLKFAYEIVRGEATRFQPILDFLASCGVLCTEMCADEHDRHAAATQALAFFTKHLLLRIGMPKTAIDTRGYEEFAALAETVRADTDELFFDLQRQNPHAATMRKRFFAEAQQLINEIDGKV